MSKGKSARKSKARPAAAKKAATAKKKPAAKRRPTPARKTAAKRKSAPAKPSRPVADVAREFADALKAGAFERAEALWSDDVVSYEAMDGPMRELRGRKAVHDKGAWWMENNEIHAFKTEGPFVTGDAFALRFSMDVTAKATGQRVTMDEVGVYKVKGGKIVEERFFY